VTALGHLGDPAAAPALTRALRDPEKHVRQAAAEALGRLRRP
jgi:HEAT repeat protein